MRAGSIEKAAAAAFSIFRLSVDEHHHPTRRTAQMVQTVEVRTCEGPKRMRVRMAPNSAALHLHRSVQDDRQAEQPYFAAHLGLWCCAHRQMAGPWSLKDRRHAHLNSAKPLPVQAEHSPKLR